MELTHVMLDIETLGTGTNACIASIGALLFNPTTSQVMDTRDTRAFHVLIDIEKSKDCGVIDPGTVRWWMRQSDAARTALFGQPAENYIPLGEALEKFATWCRLFGAEQLWSNGPMFDERIMREAFTRYGLTFPFSYRASKCFRTIAELVQAKGNDLKKLHKQFQFEANREVLAHRAIDDCWEQAFAVCRMYQILGLAPEGRVTGAGLKASV